LRAYLDNNATTQPLPEVVAAVVQCLERDWANPSSVHRAGIGARQKLELAREQVCALVGCTERELVFTSGGTEAANLALAGSLAAQPERRTIVTMRTEHSAVREAAQGLAKHGARVEWLRVGPNGVVDLAHARELLAAQASGIAVVSVMWANNETGVVQPVAAIGELCREYGVRMHCDATQWIGRMPADLASLPVDLASFSGHKFHGPKGIGALFVRRGVRVEPLVVGGPQERDRRGGTENVAGAVGMGVAAESARAWLAGGGPKALGALRDRFEQNVLRAVPDAQVNGAAAERLPNTTNVAFPHLEAEAILLLLSERGIAASAGAACSSGSLDPSPVLLAMGIPEALAHGSVRFSISRLTTSDELAWAAPVVAECIAKLRKSW
jgi:cysteine desulfurase